MSDAHAAVLPRTPLSVTETHHYSHGRYSVWPKVYFQDTQGRIRTVDGNDGGESKVAVDTANINSRFAAISWGGPETGIQQEVSNDNRTFVDPRKRTDVCCLGTSLLHQSGWPDLRGMHTRQPPPLPADVLTSSSFSTVGIRAEGGIRVNSTDSTGPPVTHP